MKCRKPLVAINLDSFEAQILPDSNDQKQYLLSLAHTITAGYTQSIIRMIENSPTFTSSWNASWGSRD